MRVEKLSPILRDEILARWKQSSGGCLTLPPWKNEYPEWLTSDFRKRYFDFKRTVASFIAPQRVLEFGVGAGISAQALDIEGEYLGVDSMRDYDIFPHRDYRQWWRDRQFKVREDWTTDLTPDDVRSVRPDLVHLDADHSYEGVYHEMTICMEARVPWILVDDADNFEVVTAAFDAVRWWAYRYRKERLAVRWEMFPQTWHGDILFGLSVEV